MKSICIFFLCLFCRLSHAAEPPEFYVLSVRHTGEAVLHANTDHVPKADQQYALADTGAVNCCFRFGTKPGVHKPSIKIAEDAPPLTSSIGEEMYRFPGYLTAQPGAGKRAASDTLAFGVVGMTGVTAKEKNTYEVAFGDGTKPLFVRKCLGAEGVNFRLYHGLAEKKPFVTYYFALGYDTKPDCR
jgi:hypothetical protein